MRQRLDGLADENRRAWRIYHMIATRVIADLHAGSTALAWAAADVPADERPDLLARLAVIDDAVRPRPKSD